MVTGRHLKVLLAFSLAYFIMFMSSNWSINYQEYRLFLIYAPPVWKTKAVCMLIAPFSALLVYEYYVILINYVKRVRGWMTCLIYLRLVTNLRALYYSISFCRSRFHGQRREKNSINFMQIQPRRGARETRWVRARVGKRWLAAAAKIKDLSVSTLVSINKTLVLTVTVTLVRLRE